MESNELIEIAEFYVENKETLRGVAAAFGTSKSTVHTGFRNNLADINFNLYEKVLKLLEINKELRSVRDGAATKEKFRRQKKCLTM